ncbi:MAG: aminoacetone oxidase family FAD-binding enzyme [Planctomycetota bacterium]
MTEPLRVIVVGAGAAGLMAATTAAQRGCRVTLLEKNRKTGVKILMSGGTRCNITQATDSRGIVDAFDAVGNGGRFLRHSVGRFTPDDVVAFFESQGVATKREETGKIFPVSDRAVHVRDALHQAALKAGVQIGLGAAVIGFHNIASQAGKRWQVSFQQSGHTESIEAERVIVTSGGQSWPGCGTTGDAYAWLRELGHRIIPPRPALVPLLGGFDWTHDLAGLTLPCVEASVLPAKGKKPIVRRSGGWLFTHFGFSGPTPMDVSGRLLCDPSGNVHSNRLRVDLQPRVQREVMFTHLNGRTGSAASQTLGQALTSWLPSRLASALATQASGLPNGKGLRLGECSRAIADRVVESIKRWQVPVHGSRGFAKAEVTAGGVALDEVCPKTMASRLHPGLFLAGEVLDVDGPIGGFNFQAAFSTGRAAGIAVSDVEA